jgi:hypothetical protein
MDTRIRFALLLAVAGVIGLGGGVLAAAGGDSDIAVVRQVTARFHDVDAAKAAGYELGYLNGAGNRIITGCIANPTAGVMGYHYFNKKLIDDLVVDEQQPEGLVYTSGRDGKLKLVAVEYVVPAPGRTRLASPSHRRSSEGRCTSSSRQWASTSSTSGSGATTRLGYSWTGTPSSGAPRSPRRYGPSKTYWSTNALRNFPSGSRRPASRTKSCRRS